MLAQQHRMRTSVQFSEVIRSGVRSGRRNLVLYALHTEDDHPSLSGFIVSKAVGNAVTRNRVKRRLRDLVSHSIAEQPTGLNIVLRALAPSAHAEWDELRADYRSAYATVRTKLSSMAPRNGTAHHGAETGR